MENPSNEHQLPLGSLVSAAAAVAAVRDKLTKPFFSRNSERGRERGGGRRKAG